VKTLVATPDPQRPRNELVWTNGTSTTATGGNTRVDWRRIDATR
jgi:hypothetical protein